MYPRRISSMRFGEGRAQAIRRRWRHDEVDVVGHQAIGPDLRLGPSRRAGDQVKISQLVIVAKEHRLPPVATLGHVVRQARNDHSSKARHPKTPGASTNSL
jgi:hypothetical protein